MTSTNDLTFATDFTLATYDDWHKLAWAGALLVTATVLTLSIIARLLETKRN